MDFAKLYKFTSPKNLFHNPQELISQQYAIYNDAWALRKIWIASRFCYGLNQLKNKSYQVRLVENEFMDFELKEAEILTFKLVEAQQQIEPPEEDAVVKDCAGVIKNAIAANAKRNSNLPGYLLCFVDNFPTDIQERLTEKISAYFYNQQLPYQKIWLFFKDRGQSHSLAQIYPQREIPFSFETPEITKRVSMIIWSVIVVFVLLCLLVIWQVYSAYKDQLIGMWGFWGFFDLFHFHER